MKKIFARSFGTVEVCVYVNTFYQYKPAYLTRTYESGQVMAEYETDSKTDAIRHAEMVIVEERRLAA